jgi:hypothetical protein
LRWSIRSRFQVGFCCVSLVRTMPSGSTAATDGLAAIRAAALGVRFATKTELAGIVSASPSPASRSAALSTASAPSPSEARSETTYRAVG